MQRHYQQLNLFHCNEVYFIIFSDQTSERQVEEE